MTLMSKKIRAAFFCIGYLFLVSNDASARAAQGAPELVVYEEHARGKIKFSSIEIEPKSILFSEQIDGEALNEPTWAMSSLSDKLGSDPDLSHTNPLAFETSDFAVMGHCCALYDFTDSHFVEVVNAADGSVVTFEGVLGYNDALTHYGKEWILILSTNSQFLYSPSTKEKEVFDEFFTVEQVNVSNEGKDFQLIGLKGKSVHRFDLNGDPDGVHPYSNMYEHAQYRLNPKYPEGPLLSQKNPTRMLPFPGIDQNDYRQFITENIKFGSTFFVKFDIVEGANSDNGNKQLWIGVHFDHELIAPLYIEIQHENIFPGVSENLIAVVSGTSLFYFVVPESTKHERGVTYEFEPNERGDAISKRYFDDFFEAGNDFEMTKATHQRCTDDYKDNEDICFPTSPFFKFVAKVDLGEVVESHSLVGFRHTIISSNRISSVDFSALLEER